VWDDRIFLTGLAEEKLWTLCIDRADGHVRWQRIAPVEQIEQAHRVGSPAAPTPTTDGHRVYVYFGSFGLLAYDFRGNEQWRKPLSPPVLGGFGAGTSPILAGNRVVLNVDQDHGSYILAVDRGDGRTVWKTDRAEFPRGFATPMLWRHDAIEEIVVPGTLRLVAYDPRGGRERWTVHGLARIVCPSPVTAEGLLVVASWAPGGDPGERVTVPPFATFTDKYDADKDGKLSRAEFPTQGAIGRRFLHFDANKDEEVDRTEWEAMADIFARSENAMLAVRPGGGGNLTETHVAWKQSRFLPYVPSPLVYRDRVHLVKDMGIATCYDVKTGERKYQGRLGAAGSYYASPIGGDGKVFMASERGVVAVLEAGDKLNVLARNDLGERIMATPAIADGKLYVRTQGICSPSASSCQRSAVRHQPEPAYGSYGHVHAAFRDPHSTFRYRSFPPP